jgi:hypothetical protein
MLPAKQQVRNQAALGDGQGCRRNYMSNIPEHLRGSIRYDNAEHSLAVFDEAIGLLLEIY